MKGLIGMKNNYQLQMGNKTVKSVAARKLCETVTFVEETLFDKNISNELCEKLVDKKLHEAWEDYGKFTNGLLERKGKNQFNQLDFDNWYLYFNRFFSLYTLVYKMTNKDIKEMLYEDMKIGEVMTKLDVNHFKYTDLFHKYEIELFDNEQFFKCKNLR